MVQLFRVTAISQFGSLCNGYPLEAMPSKYFIAQEFNANKNDLRQAIEQSLSKLGYSSVRADDFIWGGPILCKINALIQSTPFGVYQSSISQNRNVHLELGMTIGVGRPFVLIKDRDAEIAELLRGLEYYQINSYLETSYELGNLLEKYITSVGQYQQQISPTTDFEDTAVIAHGYLAHIDFTIVIAKALQQYGLRPIILSSFDDRLVKFLEIESIDCDFVNTLDETVLAIQTSRLGIYRIDKSADASTFVALGIAMGLNRAALLIHEASKPIPSDLQGLNKLSFMGFLDLKRNFVRKFSFQLTNCAPNE